MMAKARKCKRCGEVIPKDGFTIYIHSGEYRGLYGKCCARLVMDKLGIPPAPKEGSDDD